MCGPASGELIVQARPQLDTDLLLISSICRRLITGTAAEYGRRHRHGQDPSSYRHLSINHLELGMMMIIMITMIITIITILTSGQSNLTKGR